MFKSTKLVVPLMTALAVLIGTASAAYYFLGVSPLNTAGIAQLNDNITRMKNLLTSSEADNAQLTSALTTVQASLSHNAATITKLTHDNSVLATAVTDRYQAMMATAMALNIPDLSQYYVTPPNDNPFTDQNGQVLDSDKLSPVILNAITALKTASATSQDWQNKYTDLQSAIRAAYLDAGGDPTQQPTLATLMQQLKAQTIAQFTAQINAVGIAIAWLNDGPTYHSPANPNLIFKSNHISWGTTTVAIPDDTGQLASVTLPVIWQGATNDQLIWNGFGWVIYKDGQIYTDATDDKGQAIGLAFVNLRDIATRIKMPDGTYRIVLWGSTAHIFAKAFLPDLNMLPGGATRYQFTFDAQNNFIATPYNSIQNPGHYQFITPPNAKDVDAATLSQNYYRYDYTVNTTNANDTPITLHKSIEIPNTPLFQHLIP